LRRKIDLRRNQAWRYNGKRASCCFDLEPFAESEDGLFLSSGEADLFDPNTKDWFENCLRNLGVSDAELSLVTADLQEDNSLTEQIDWVLDAIKSLCFDFPQCPLQVMWTYLLFSNEELETKHQNQTVLAISHQILHPITAVHIAI